MDRFSVGVGVKEIALAPGAPQWGYSARQQPGAGTLDPLHAKALLFAAGDERVALVVMDLGRVPTDAVLGRIRERARAAGVSRVVFCATHTHHGPVVEDDAASCIAAIEGAAVTAVESAVATLRPARLGVGRAFVDIGHNRRKLVDERCYMVWRNEAREPTGPVDREATLVKLESEDGCPLATLVHYACHPVVMGPENLLYSADYPGELTRVVSEATGAPCVFLQGACGDINPYLDKTPADQDAVATMRAVGRTAAEAVLEGLADIRCEAPDTPMLAHIERPVRVGTRWDFADPEVLRTFQRFHVGLFDRYVQNLVPDLEVPLTVLVLNRQLALVGIPGEPPVQFQLEFKASSPVPCGLVCGYTNGYHAYFPSVRDALAGGYGGTVGSYVGLGAGERLMAEAKVEIARLLGKHCRRCTVDDFQVTDYA